MLEITVNLHSIYFDGRIACLSQCLVSEFHIGKLCNGDRCWYEMAFHSLYSLEFLRFLLNILTMDEIISDTNTPHTSVA
jgi:hypothetical protein